MSADPFVAMSPGETLGICSMATRGMLADLSTAFHEQSGEHVRFEAVGGVIAAKRIRSGERFDLIVLADDVVDGLASGGYLNAGSRVGLAVSSIAAAVPAGRAKPDVSNEAALRRAILAASSIAYSTGPSGDQLIRLWDRWGLTETLVGRLRQAPAGVPVATLLALGEADLGFQQLSELQGAPGIEIAGRLAAELGMNTVFAGAVGSVSRQLHVAQHFLSFSASTDVFQLKRRHGMDPV